MPRMPAFGGMALDFGGSIEPSPPDSDNTTPESESAGKPGGRGGLLSLLGLNNISQESLDKKWQDMQRQRDTKDQVLALRALDDEDGPYQENDSQSFQSGGSDGMDHSSGPKLRPLGMGLGLDLGGGDSSSDSDSDASPSPTNVRGRDRDGGDGAPNRATRPANRARLNKDFDGSYDITANGTLELKSYRIKNKGIRFGTAIPYLDPSDLEQTGSLGAGASGKVIRCLHRPSGLTLALKSIDISDKAKRDQLTKELRELDEESCPHLVGFYNMFFAEGQMHLALEYMDRGSLESIVERHGPLHERVLAEVARRMLFGLDHLHTGRKIHRDIKPGNVLVNAHGEVKISDFGILARLEDNDDDHCKTFVGTTVYMSPERIDSQTYSFPGDIWSFGLTIMYCAIGRLPISTAGGYRQLLSRLAKDPPPELSDDFAPDLRDFVAKSLIKDPNERWSARQLLAHPFLNRHMAMGLGAGRVCPYWPEALEMTPRRTAPPMGFSDTLQPAHREFALAAAAGGNHDDFSSGRGGRPSVAAASGFDRSATMGGAYMPRAALVQQQFQPQQHHQQQMPQQQMYQQPPQQQQHHYQRQQSQQHGHYAHPGQEHEHQRTQHADYHHHQQQQQQQQQQYQQQYYHQGQPQHYDQYQQQQMPPHQYGQDQYYQQHPDPHMQQQYAQQQQYYHQQPQQSYYSAQQGYHHQQQQQQQQHDQVPPPVPARPSLSGSSRLSGGSMNGYRLSDGTITRPAAAAAAAAVAHGGAEGEAEDSFGYVHDPNGPYNAQRQQLYEQHGYDGGDGQYYTARGEGASEEVDAEQLASGLGGLSLVSHHNRESRTAESAEITQVAPPRQYVSFLKQRDEERAAAAAAGEGNGAAYTKTIVAPAAADARQFAASETAAALSKSSAPRMSPQMGPVATRSSSGSISNPPAAPSAGAGTASLSGLSAPVMSAFGGQGGVLGSVPAAAAAATPHTPRSSFSARGPAPAVGAAPAPSVRNSRGSVLAAPGSAAAAGAGAGAGSTPARARGSVAESMASKGSAIKSRTSTATATAAGASGTPALTRGRQSSISAAGAPTAGAPGATLFGARGARASVSGGSAASAATGSTGTMTRAPRASVSGGTGATVLRTLTLQLPPEGGTTRGAVSRPPLLHRRLRRRNPLL